MEDQAEFLLRYDELYQCAEQLIREALQVTPVQDDMQRGELRGFIRLWDMAALKTGRAELDVYRDKRRLQILARLPEVRGED